MIKIQNLIKGNNVWRNKDKIKMHEDSENVRTKRLKHIGFVAIVNRKMNLQQTVFTKMVLCL